MILSKATINNIASVFKYTYEKMGNESVALSVLKILDFDYKDKCLLYKDSPIENYDELDVSFEITPISLNSFDIDCIETVLNNLGLEGPVLSPLLDCIGWVITRDENSKYKIHFIGGPNYEVWREPGIPWDYDMDSEDKNWIEGSNWVDGWDLSRDTPREWV